MIVVTGGAGFIGTNFVDDWLASCDEALVVLDKLTYAGHLDKLRRREADPRFSFVQADIGDRPTVRALFERERPRAVLHFAAETHVDRSIHGPAPFIRTNVNGTFELLEATRAYFATLDGAASAGFRFLHVSTDEVFGSLGPSERPFSESSAYSPNSPYAASKAASDHLVRAYHQTYGLPTLTTHCSNNYGPYQFPEKLIPLIILNAVRGKKLPVYGDGRNVRDWLFVGDHCAALRAILERGRPGETYNIGGGRELENLEVVRTVCGVLDRLRPTPAGPYANLIRFVEDRPGHDRRYAIDPTKVEQEIGWRPASTFEDALGTTVQWYLDHRDWVDKVSSDAYRDWLALQYRVAD
jgi:dTDP-glucose 4,6-dehydratase